jgi:aspartate 1-decarboxylase
MLITVLKAKIAYAKITQKDLHYEGSITVDEAMLNEVGISENEQVQVINAYNGERFVTYAIKGPAGSGIIGLNGGAARKGEIGDEVIIITYAQIDPKQEKIEPKILNLKGKNNVFKK